jgi:endo-1,4-beta-xylanase
MKNFTLFSFTTFICSILLFSCSKDENKTNNTAFIEKLVPPVATNGSNISTYGFTANWTSSVNITEYEIDVATDPEFNTILPNYKSIKVKTNSLKIENPNSTIFYYRVKSYRNAESTAYSNTIKVETLGLINTTTFLKDIVNKKFLIGVAVKNENLTNTYNTLINREFTSLTSEYEMKMDQILIGKNEYNWKAVDKLLEYASTNNLNVHGHALVWHNSVPKWLNEFTGTDAEFEQIVKDYITTVVTYCKSKVSSWDVVNEVFEDNGTPRNSIFRQKLGADYVKKCFQWTRDAAIAAGDNNLLLFYNDYGTSDNIPKQNAVYTLVDNLKANNLIDGVGLQMHVTYNSPTKQQIADDTNKIVSRGLKVHYSEVDIRANSSNPAILDYINDRKIAQKIKMREIVQLFNAIPAANKFGITIWGVRDNDSWIRFNRDFGNRIDWPLLFDDNFAPKHIHTGFLEGLD